MQLFALIVFIVMCLIVGKYAISDHRKQEIVAQKIQEDEAAKKAAIAKTKSDAAAVAEHETFLNRYVSRNVTKKAGVTTVALVVSSEERGLNRPVADALALHLKTETTEPLTSFFSGDFITDGLFDQAFSGSAELFRKLELANVVGALVLARQAVKYSPTPDAQNLITANMQLEVVIISLSEKIRSQGATFTGNAAGFTKTAARQLAEERLIEQIIDDTQLSLIN